MVTVITTVPFEESKGEILANSPGLLRHVYIFVLVSLLKAWKEVKLVHTATKFVG
jgi:hypothetical protein